MQCYPAPMLPRSVTVATHGHCFDGMASAVLFTRLMHHLYPNRSLEIGYRSCGYGPKMQTVPPRWLRSDINAILDFRFSPTDRLTWYFDHHVTAFESDEELKAATGRASREVGVHLHYDPSYGSCTKLIADVAADVHGLELGTLRSLVEWADRIDAARFASAEEAMDGETPTMRLATLVEHRGDGPWLTAIVPRLLSATVEEVAAAPDLREQYRPLGEARSKYLDVVRERAEVRGSVVIVDLADRPMQVGAKFATYLLFPKCRYSITLIRGSRHVKMTVGYNPWCGLPRQHDIAAICRRLGGGGHPVVGAANFTIAELDRARQAVRDVARQLEEPESEPSSRAP